MGIEKNKAQESRAARKSGKALGSLARLSPASEAEVSEMDAAALKGAVLAVIKDGSAIMFGLTSDQGALCITVLVGEERRKEYLHDAEEINWYLGALREHFSE